MTAEEKVPVGIYLPRPLLKVLDTKRGRISRSTYVTILLEKVLVEEPKVA